MNIEKITKHVPIVVIILGVFLGVQTLNALKEFRYIGDEGMPQNIITVVGKGEEFVIPDVATFTFGATEVGDDVKMAQDAVTKKIDVAINALRALGIEEKDIRTTDFNAYPKYEYNQVVCITYPCPGGNQELVGYEVSQMISVKVRNVDNAGVAIDAVTKSGISNVSGLSFTIDDEDEAKRTARQEAIRDAREKARELARDLDVKLVRIVNFSENNGGYGMPYYAKAEIATDSVGGSRTPSLPVGQNKIQSEVVITYEIR